MTDEISVDGQIYTNYFRNVVKKIHHHHHNLSRETSTAGHRPPPKFSKTICPVLPSSSDFSRPSPDRWSTLPINAASPGTRWPFEDLSAPTAVSHPRNLPMCVSRNYIQTYSRFIPEGVVKTSQIILRDTHILPK
jgi:hypothetical protein